MTVENFKKNKIFFKQNKKHKVVKEEGENRTLYTYKKKLSNLIILIKKIISFKYTQYIQTSGLN